MKNPQVVISGDHYVTLCRMIRKHISDVVSEMNQLDQSDLSDLEYQCRAMEYMFETRHFSEMYCYIVNNTEYK